MVILSDYLRLFEEQYGGEINFKVTDIIAGSVACGTRVDISIKLLT
jgi:hypothetical protein